MNSYAEITEVTLRFLVPEDVQQVRELCSEWFPIDYPNLWYECITETNQYYALAATHKGSIVGLLVAQTKPVSDINDEDRLILQQAKLHGGNIGYILTLGVRAQHRRQGLASLLLNQYIEHLRLDCSHKCSRYRSSRRRRKSRPGGSNFRAVLETPSEEPEARDVDSSSKGCQRTEPAATARGCKPISASDEFNNNTTLDTLVDVHLEEDAPRNHSHGPQETDDCAHSGSNDLIYEGLTCSDLVETEKDLSSSKEPDVRIYVGEDISQQGPPEEGNCLDPSKTASNVTFTAEEEPARVSGAGYSVVREVFAPSLPWAAVGKPCFNGGLGDCSGSEAQATSSEGDVQHRYRGGVAPVRTNTINSSYIVETRLQCSSVLERLQCCNPGLEIAAAPVTAVLLHVLHTNKPAMEFYSSKRFLRQAFLPMFYYINEQRCDGYSYVLYINGGEPPQRAGTFSLRGYYPSAAALGHLAQPLSAQVGKMSGWLQSGVQSGGGILSVLLGGLVAVLGRVVGSVVGSEQQRLSSGV